MLDCRIAARRWILECSGYLDEVREWPPVGLGAAFQASSANLQIVESIPLLDRMSLYRSQGILFRSLEVICQCLRSINIIPVWIPGYNFVGDQAGWTSHTPGLQKTLRNHSYRGFNRSVALPRNGSSASISVAFFSQITISFITNHFTFRRNLPINCHPDSFLIA